MEYRNMGKQCLVLLLVFMINGCMFRFAPKIPPMLTTNTYSVEEFNNDYKSYNSSPSTMLRDKMIFSVAGEIDKSYMQFRNSLFRGVAAGTTALQMTQMGLTSAATLAGGESAKAILAAIATGVSGSALSFGKNFFKEKSSDLLISRMDALRAQKWNLIYTKITAADTIKYSWYEAERDLVEYFWAGSVQAAIQSIFIESGAKENKANTDTERRIRATFTALPSKEDPELKSLMSELNKLSDAEQEARAATIVSKFHDMMPLVNINPDATVHTKLGDLDWLIIQAHENKELRANLIKAFNDAKKEAPKG